MVTCTELSNVLFRLKKVSPALHCESLYCSSDVSHDTSSLIHMQQAISRVCERSVIETQIEIIEIGTGIAKHGFCRYR